ncbi:MAG: anhydro-N-acetylmuramic acid kinase [Pseudomonadota bacterium]
MILKSIGLMSGTSMDGIDAALIETDGHGIINHIASYSLSYSDEFKLQLRDAELKVRKAKSNIASLEIVKESTELHFEAVKQLLKKANLQPNEIDLIGYHGQSLYHNPAEKITIQIGDGQLLANLTGIKVVNDFRSEDIKNGGQGAPLAPIYHRALAIKHKLYPVAFVNCGGIANISVIPDEDINKVYGYDTGPGNVLIDRYIRDKTNNEEFMDLDGKYGLQGAVNQAVLKKLIDSIKTYLTKSPPKSLDPGDLHLIKELNKLSFNDACATLESFTAYCIVNSFCGELPSKWILAGGGWNNPVITKYLKEFLLEKNQDIQVYKAEDIGLDGTYIEAEIFAYLAVRSYKELSITIPSVTGASKASYGIIQLPRTFN